jgi:hypothetical protein
MGKNITGIPDLQLAEGSHYSHAWCEHKLSNQPNCEESMTTMKAIRLASVVTAINVLVASGFSIAAIIRPQYLLPAGSVPTQASLILAMYAAARTIPLALFALGAIYKQAAPALLILGALASTMQLLDAGIGLFEHDIGKCAGPLFIAILQFFVVYLLHRSVRIAPQTKRE